MPQSPREPVRLHYTDVCTLIRFIEEVQETEKATEGEVSLPLSPEELHAYQRLKEMKTAMEEYFRWKEERDFRQKGKL